MNSVGTDMLCETYGVDHQGLRPASLDKYFTATTIALALAVILEAIEVPTEI